MQNKFKILFLIFFCLVIQLEICWSAKELSPLQRMSRLGRSLFGTLGSSRQGMAEVRLSRGNRSPNRNYRPKRIRLDAIQMPSQLHLTAEDPLFNALTSTAHRQSKPLILPIDLSQLSFPLTPHLPPTHVQFPDLDPNFLRGSADDYLLDRGFDLTKNGHSPTHSTVLAAHPLASHQIEAHLSPEFTDSNLLPFLELDRQFNNKQHNQNSQSSLTPALLEQHAAAQFISASAQPPPSQLTPHSPSTSIYGGSNAAQQLIQQLAQQGDALSDYIFDLSEARTTASAAAAGESSRKRNPPALINELTPIELASYGLKNEYMGDEAVPLTKYNVINGLNDDELKYGQVPSNRWTLENQRPRKSSKEAANRALWQYIRKSAALNGRLGQLLAEESWPTMDDSNLALSSRSSPGKNKSSSRKRDREPKSEPKSNQSKSEFESEIEDKIKNIL